MKTIHLVCNAHLDPVWLWEWEEGAAEALSTFRVAADFCEAYDGFIFNHNEVILYQWVEEYEPQLFKRIQTLVKQGKWHIMGGWYLQPDCNMPSGESFVRQALLGRTYFKEKFGVIPRTAINFDPFGHTRGLVQILQKSGFDSYIFCRPFPDQCVLPGDDFTWVGYDGSQIAAHRAFDNYLSLRGEARLKVQKWMEQHPDKKAGLVLWGIGNHGGGPSRLDLAQLSELMQESGNFKIIHSTPEAYFRQHWDIGTPCPTHDKDLNSIFVGCYTSQIRIKQKHRLLENELYMTEKMMSHAAIQGYAVYPSEALQEAVRDLMTAEFHDILPGSSIQPVEEASLRLMDHGLEILSRLKARAFFALASGQDKAREGEIPILVYNPHPYKVRGLFECEFQLPDQNWNEGFSMPVVYRKGIRIPSQVEKELSNLNLDWRKRISFIAELEPGQMNRFDCCIEKLPAKPQPELHPIDGKLIFQTAELEVVINCKTGLVDAYKVNGTNFLLEGAFLPLVIEDNDDPWGSEVQSFRQIAGHFTLMPPGEGTRYSGIQGKALDSVRVVEDGEARTVIEALFKYGDSFLVQTYKLPKYGTEIQVQLRVQWNEKNKMLKLSIPTSFKQARYVGQVAFGTDDLPGGGMEAVAQKWTAVVSERQKQAFTCINDGGYGSDYDNGEMRVSLIRSPGYSSLPILDRPLMAQDRYSPRIDQGERVFQFWFNAGDLSQRLDEIDRNALAHNEKPYALSFFPSGEGLKPKSHVHLSDDAILMTAFKKAERSDDYIIRLFEPTGKARATIIGIPALGIRQEVHFGKFEVKTFRLQVADRLLSESDLMEGCANE